MRASDERFLGYEVDDDAGRLDVARVHGWLASAYWSEGIPREIVEKAIAHSLVFGVYGPQGQVGFARVVTDRATYAWLCDVFVAPEARGRGLGEWMISCVMAHPELQGLRNFHLGTRDAHGLYARFGFAPPLAPERAMAISVPDIYKRMKP